MHNALANESSCLISSNFAIKCIWTNQCGGVREYFFEKISFYHVCKMYLMNHLTLPRNFKNILSVLPSSFKGCEIWRNKTSPIIISQSRMRRMNYIKISQWLKLWLYQVQKLLLRKIIVVWCVLFAYICITSA